MNQQPAPQPSYHQSRSGLVIPDTVKEKRPGPDDYRSPQGAEYYPASPKGCGFFITVLPELVGCKWGELPLALIHGVRPSGIRVVTDEVTQDIVPGRVTVVVDGGDIIQAVTQEVVVALPEGTADGRRLSEALQRQPGWSSRFERPVPEIDDADDRKTAHDLLQQLFSLFDRGSGVSDDKRYRKEAIRRLGHQLLGKDADFEELT